MIINKSWEVYFCCHTDNVTLINCIFRYRLRLRLRQPIDCNVDLESTHRESSGGNIPNHAHDRSTPAEPYVAKPSTKASRQQRYRDKIKEDAEAYAL